MKDSPLGDLDNVSLFIESLAVVYDNLGGELRCGTCDNTRPLKRSRDEPWPTCCDSLMAWWTEADIERGWRNQNDRPRSPLWGGSRPRRRKWSPEHVRKIVTMNKEGMSQRAIARELGIPKSTVGSILKRETWTQP